MPPRRIAPLESPVHLEVDGERLRARAGEPVAVALTASGRLTLGRSVKYHRPRGAVCYAGRCDGCLMRVDGVQSVMTCRAPVEDGMVVETQNVLGSARVDLLAATDWFFPGGMNHHKMFTWSEAVNKVMQKVARRIAGIGTLPEEAREPRPAAERDVDAIVLGGGPAGLVAARTIAQGGLSVSLIEEEPRCGGTLLFWPGATPDGEDPRALARELEAAARDAGAELLTRTSTVGLYDPWEDAAGAGNPPIAAPAARTSRPVVVVHGPSGLTRFLPRRVVVAMGRASGGYAFAGSDRPGVIDFQAACKLLAWGVLPGESVALIGERDAGTAALAHAIEEAGAKVHGPFSEEAVREARGRPVVDELEVEVDGASGTIECDAVVVRTPTTAVYELAAQAGVPVHFDGAGYELEADPEDGRTSIADVRVVGADPGRDLARAITQAERAGRAIVEELS